MSIPACLGARMGLGNSRVLLFEFGGGTATGLPGIPKYPGRIQLDKYLCLTYARKNNRVESMELGMNRKRKDRDEAEVIINNTSWGEDNQAKEYLAFSGKTLAGQGTVKSAKTGIYAFRGCDPGCVLVTEGWLEIDKHFSLELCFSIEKQPVKLSWLWPMRESAERKLLPLCCSSLHGIPARS